MAALLVLLVVVAVATNAELHLAPDLALRWQMETQTNKIQFTLRATQAQPHFNFQPTRIFSKSALSY